MAMVRTSVKVIGLAADSRALENRCEVLSIPQATGWRCWPATAAILTRS